MVTIAICLVSIIFTFNLSKPSESFYRLHCILFTVASVKQLLTKIIWEQATLPPLAEEPLIAATHSCSTILPGGASVHAHLIHDSLGPPSVAEPWASLILCVWLHLYVHTLEGKWLSGSRSACNDPEVRGERSGSNALRAGHACRQDCLGFW